MISAQAQSEIQEMQKNHPDVKIFTASLDSSLNEILDNLIEISSLAGSEILDVYNGNINVTLKDDLSPLTDADRRSNEVIVSRLNDLYPDIPILSEEGQKIEYKERQKWNLFWLIDPLDGTKEFIKQNGEFTVNIALIGDGNPLAGVVYAPTTDTFWYGAKDIGSYKKNNRSTPESISVRDANNEIVKIVSSRSHPSPKLQTYLNKFENHEIVSMGSSLKFCLVAVSLTISIAPIFFNTAQDSGALPIEADVSNMQRMDLFNLCSLWAQHELL